jgi:iron complex outermembrane receptor protein
MGIVYEWRKSSLVYLNASRSFQPPSFDESLGIQEGENGGRTFHELHSQKAITLELGTRGEAGQFQWDATLYRSWVRDELLDQNNNQGEPLGTINASRTIHQGLELGLETELFHSLLVHPAQVDPSKGDAKNSQKLPLAKPDRLVWEQTYVFSDFRFDDHPVYGTHRVAGTPVHFYKGELRYEHPSGFYLGTNVEWNIVKYPVDEAGSLFADPYALFGLRAGYRTKKGLQVSFEARNLLDKVYAATVEPLGNARVSDDTANFNPGNGRAFYGSLSWTW